MLWTDAFGENCFFGPRLGREFETRCVAPCAPADVALAGHASVSRAEALQLLRTKYLLGGLRNAGNTCYISAVLQMLLHMPAVLVWLEEHGRVCVLRSHRCLVCALSESRKQFGLRDVPPVLTMERSKVAQVFAGYAQHDAAEFLGCLLDKLRQTECRAFRFSPWRGRTRRLRPCWPRPRRSSTRYTTTPPPSPLISSPPRYMHMKGSLVSNVTVVVQTLAAVPPQFLRHG